MINIISANFIKSAVSIRDSLPIDLAEVAFLGRSNVGKSSLINALLRRKGISPTGIFQTTGVPIQILPGKEDFVKISYLHRQVLFYPKQQFYKKYRQMKKIGAKPSPRTALKSRHTHVQLTQILKSLSFFP